jgi:hypothetical protein
MYPMHEGDGRTNGHANGDGRFHSATGWVNQHDFLNISITPTECSIACSNDVAEAYFAPVIQGLSRSPKSGVGSSQAIISSEDYVAICVQGEGMQAGRRLVELTSPLALAGM